MRKLLFAITARPRLWLTCTIILILGLASQLPRLKQAADVSTLVSDDNIPQNRKREMEKIFGNSSYVFVAAPDAFNITTLQQIREVADLLKTQDGVYDVFSVYTAKHLSGGSGAFDVQDILKDPPTNEEEIFVLREKLKANKSYRGNLWGLDENSLNLIIEFKPGVTEDHMKHTVVETLAKANVKWVASGYSFVNAKVKDSMDRDLHLLVPVVFVLIAVSLYFFFETLRGVLLPLMSISIAILVAMGTMAVFGVTLNPVSNAIPTILIAIAASYGIHFLNQYYVEMARDGVDSKKDQRLVVIAAGEHCWKTVLAGGSTTIAGFLANLATPVTPIREFGVITAVGVAAAAMAAMVVTPAILMLLKPQVDKRRGPQANNPIVTYLNWQWGFMIRHTKPMAVFYALLVVGLVAVMPMMTSNYSMLGYFKEDSDVVSDARAVSRQFGGVLAFDVTIRTGREDGVKNARILKAIENFEHWIKRSYPDDIEVTLSLADYAKQMSLAYNGEPQYYRIPESDDEIAQYLEVYKWSGNIEKDLRSVVDAGFTQTRVSGRFKLREHSDGSFSEQTIGYYQNVVETGVKQLQAELPEGAETFMYGDIPMWSSTLKSIVQGQISSCLSAVLIVFVLAFWMIRSLSLAMLSIVPVILAVIFNYGVMAIFNIELDIATSLVSSMAIGIGIEDSLHFLINFKERRLDGADNLTALRENFMATGQAIIYTTVTLMAGYSALMLSAFKPMIYFGLLNVLAIFVATVAALQCLPLLIMLFPPKVNH